MTIRAIRARGFVSRKERGDAAKLRELALRSQERWELLEWVEVARLYNLRTANRRWRRRMGLSLKAA